MSMQWTPYRWNPVAREGEDLRLTFWVEGIIDAMEATVGDLTRDFAFSGDGAQVVFTAGEMASVPDRSPVLVRVQTGGVWSALMEGFLTRRLTT